MALLALTPILVNLSYTSIFIWFLIFNNFIPIFEELALISIGYSSALGVVNPIIAIIISIIALGIVDSVVYFLTLKGSKYFKFIEKATRYGLIIKYKMKMQQNFNKTFILLTFTPRMRFLAPALAGMLKKSWKKFLFLETLSLSLFVCVYFFCGFFFYKEIAKIFSSLRNWRHLILAGIIDTLFILSIFAARWVKKKYNI